MTGPDRPRLRVYAADTAPLKEEALYLAARRAVRGQRLEKTDRLRFEKDKRLSLGAELLLRHACRAFGIAYERERIVTDAFEKPGFESGCAFFSLSHSEERVMCAVADMPVGCDVQQEGAADLTLAKRFFSEEEYNALSACDTEQARVELFFRLWTLKESFMKCTGLGFRLPLNAFCVSVGADGVNVRQTVDAARYRFFEKDPRDGYRYACCVRLPADTQETAPVWETVALEEALAQ